MCNTPLLLTWLTSIRHIRFTFVIGMDYTGALHLTYLQSVDLAGRVHYFGQYEDQILRQSLEDPNSAPLKYQYLFQNMGSKTVRHY